MKIKMQSNTSISSTVRPTLEWKFKIAALFLLFFGFVGSQVIAGSVRTLEIDWSNLSNCASEPNSVTSELISNFSLISCGQKKGGGEENSSLPIEVVSFEATTLDGEIQLEWLVASELNNSFFTIERSKDREEFETIMQLPGAGNSSNLRTYNTVDQNPTQGLSFYRLKSHQLDGTEHIYNIIEILISERSELNMVLSPNPLNEEGQINISMGNMPQFATVKLEIMDIQGKRYFTRDYVSNEYGTIETTISPSQFLLPGIYFLVADSGNDQISQKLIVR